MTTIQSNLADDAHRKNWDWTTIWFPRPLAVAMTVAILMAATVDLAPAAEIAADQVAVTEVVAEAVDADATAAVVVAVVAAVVDAVAADAVKP